jgi:hypothetical protein
VFRSTKENPMTSQTATKVSKRDALAVLKAILTTFPAYVCDGHESLSGAHMGETVLCDGTCQLTVAVKPNGYKTYAQMDATPTLCGHTHEELPVGCWSIFWEGGNSPEDWVLSDELDRAVREATEGRVSIEPINNCILGVYPA